MNRISAALGVRSCFVHRCALAAIVLVASPAAAQRSVSYDVSFPNAARHEAEITVTWTEVPPTSRFVFRMSRSSPGRYALHEFAKNVHDVSAAVNGTEMPFVRPDPYSWAISNARDSVVVRYTLFADRAGGTYSGIDRTHAHLNIPATFMWAPGTEDYPITVRFQPADASWKAATQLFPTSDRYTFTAPNLYYFLDSPVELSDHELRTWTVDEGRMPQAIRLAVHHQGTSAEVDAYAETAKKVVAEQIAVYGEPPMYDGGTYTFIADYLPYIAGDGMEHRNSTIIASTRPLATGALQNLGTLSHEYFHQWNVERIRPKSLEPFDFTRANMSGELWFAEGFTSYYTWLIIRRAGLIDDEAYAEELGSSVNAILNFPGTRYFSAVEMSMQAPFVDAATAVDPTNERNRFLSYYTWGNGIGLALDLTLRLHFDLTLDGYMRKLWVEYGVPEKPYVIDDLKRALAEYTDDRAFASQFFGRFVEGHDIADYTELLGTFGFQLRLRNPTGVWVGAGTRTVGDGLEVAQYPIEGSALYAAGVSEGDIITAINGVKPAAAAFGSLAPGRRVRIDFVQRGVAHSATVRMPRDPNVDVVTFESAGLEVSPEIAARRREWLSSRVPHSTNH